MGGDVLDNLNTLAPADLPYAFEVGHPPAHVGQQKCRRASSDLAFEIVGIEHHVISTRNRLGTRVNDGTRSTLEVDASTRTPSSVDAAGERVQEECGAATIRRSWH
jgi:hypothetical protein